MPYLLVERGLRFLSKNEAVAAVQSAQFCFVVRSGLFGRESQGGGNACWLVGSSQQGQSVETGTFTLICACVEQVASRHLIHNFIFAIGLLRDNLQVSPFQVEAGRDLDRQWHTLGQFQNIYGSGFRDCWQRRLVFDLLTQ